VHPSTSPDLPIAQLRTEVTGRVVAPGDAAYDELRAIGEGGFDCRPAVIIRPASAADVVVAVRLARESRLEIAVRSGGHSSAGFGTTDGGIVVDMRDLTGFDLDPADRTAWVGAGFTARELTARAFEHGLVIPFGDTGSVGIGGLTVAGGFGYLVRKHGLTIDSLLGAEIVTADGQVLQVDAGSHPDLFWAIRGGGGNLGIVTRFRFQLHDLEHTTGGLLVLPATPASVAAFVAAAGAAPEELSAIANVMPAPPLPFLPVSVHGQPVIVANLLHSGNADVGEGAMAPFRAIAEPLVDQLRPVPYPEMFPPEAEGQPQPVTEVRALFLDHVGEPEAAAILDALAASSAPMRVAQLRVLGGAYARVPADATAFAHRGCRIMLTVVAVCAGPEDRATQRAWATGLADRLDQGYEGTYIAFMGDESPERVRQAYPGATWERLQGVKARYDPTNLFHRNHNVPPPTISVG
jgi:FAD/FMN-containing dehydrogenase